MMRSGTAHSAISDRWKDWIAPVTLVAAWSITTETGMVPSLFLPSPRSIIEAVLDLRWLLFVHAFATAMRAVIGLFIGVIWGFTLGVLMATNRTIYRILHNVIESWRPVPPIALIPFFLLWFGFSDAGKILLVALGVGLVILVDTYERVRSTPPTLLRAAFSLGATHRQVVRRVTVPYAVAGLTGPLRVAGALAIGLVIASEFMGATQGLGYLINISKVTFRTPTIMMCVILLGGISWLLDLLIRTLMRRLAGWQETADEAVQRPTGDFQ